MSKRRLSRFLLFCLALISLTAGGGACTQPAAKASEGAELVVHEWGTFTSVAGRDGEALAWRPLSFESDLPAFVYSIDRGKSWEGGLRYPTKSSRAVTVRMETPLLYFYAKGETTVAVKVGFTGGTITEWYPQARSGGASIDWGRFEVLPGTQADFPHEKGQNHYYPARDTDAATLRVRGEGRTEHEKFLFYRGVGDFRLPLTVLLGGGKVVLRNTHASGVGKIIVFERRAGKSGYVVGEAQRGESSHVRPALVAGAEPPRGEIKSVLMSHGLFEKEAEAMLNTWRDSWFEEGLRVFYVLPRETVDAILPVTIDPQPKELVRVLVGRAELVTPEMEGDVAEQLARLDDPSERVRESALKEINKYGRFTDTILRQVSVHATDQQTKLRVERLMRATVLSTQRRIE